MKPNLHPRYAPVVFRDRSAGVAFLTRSTMTAEQTIELEGVTYPVVDVEGRVARFQRRYGRS